MDCATVKVVMMEKNKMMVAMLGLVVIRATIYLAVWIHAQGTRVRGVAHVGAGILLFS